MQKEILSEADPLYNGRRFKVSNLAKFFAFFILMKYISFSFLTFYIYSCLTPPIKVPWNQINEELAEKLTNEEIIGQEFCNEMLMLFEIFDVIFAVCIYGSILLLG
mmetsp:Transcript_33316/g.32390  ORF Transcript_33316/g.32390 Transcript_33316/m.32390 type:complete len:106 (+) Transcript_33316:128-445(+)